MSDDPDPSTSRGIRAAVERFLTRERRAVRWLGWLGVVAVALLGGLAGWSLAPPSTVFVGPLEAQIRVVPSLDPGISAALPPIGQVVFDTHEAPVAVDASVQSVNADGARNLIGSPQAVLALQVSAPAVLTDATVRSAGIGAACALAGAVVAGAGVYRTRRRTAQTAAAALALLLATGGLTALTFDGDQLAEPRFTGLLSRAPYVAGQSVSVVQRLESYRSGLADIVQSVTTLYAVTERLPVLPAGDDGDVVTVLHVSDIHLNPLGFDVAQQLSDQFAVDVVVDTGDVTTWGTEAESSLLSRIGEFDVPYVFVRGNHDSTRTQAAVAAHPGAVVLDGDVTEVAGITFAGVGDPRFTPEGEGSPAEVRRSTERLADVVERWNDRNPDDLVDVALIHDPTQLDPLFGQVPMVLAGHLHSRQVRMDESGTLVMVQGSTGGAGITAAGLQRLSDGEPLSLSATLLYFQTSGPRAGRLLAYDQVVVGGLGLASVSIERTVLREEDAPTEPNVPQPSSRASLP